MNLKNSEKIFLSLTGAVALVILAFIIQLNGGFPINKKPKKAIQSEDVRQGYSKEFGKQAIKVSQVIDGDTLRIKGGELVRLISINAPEAGNECWQDARSRLAELTLYKKVYLENDRGKDKYGRRLAWVWLDGENLNLKLVREGLARVDIVSGKKYIKELEEAEKWARKNKIGCLWENSPK